MEEVYEEKTIRELSEKYGKKEKVFNIMLKEMKNNGYTAEQFKELIGEFYFKK